MHKIRVRFQNGDQRDAMITEDPAEWTPDVMREFMDGVFRLAFGDGRREYVFIVERAAPSADALMIEIHVGGECVRVGPSVFSAASIEYLRRRADVSWVESKDRKES